MFRDFFNENYTALHCNEKWKSSPREERETCAQAEVDIGKILPNEYWVAKFGFASAENESSKVAKR